MYSIKKFSVRRLAVCSWQHFDHKAYSAFRSLGREVKIGVLTVSTLASASAAQSQVLSVNDNAEQHVAYNHTLDELEVTGCLAPLQANLAARVAVSIGREEIAQCAAQSVNDLLRLAIGVDVRQRGAFGIQTDISIDGGSFDQVTILLNGVNIGNPQTGHLSADFPVAIEDIERIDVLEGGASRTVGGSSFSGAINIITRCDKQSHVAASVEGGSYGSVGAALRANYSNASVQNQVSGGYKRSDGGTTNSAFNRSNAFYQGRYLGQDATIDWQLGYSYQDYGANTFYSAAYPNQHEQNSRYFFSAKARTNGTVKFEPMVYWNRSYDHFELIYGKPTGENFHRTDVYGGRLNSYFSWVGGTTAFGAEVRNEGILSTNLGRPLQEDEYVGIPGEDGSYNKRDNRTNISYFAEHNVVLNKVTLSAGVVANMNTALDSRFRWYPGVDASWRPNSKWCISSSWNKSFRMPTFTDLYYKSPTTEGNIGLKPEVASTVQLAVRHTTQLFSAMVRGFFNHGTDMIDWVMYDANDKFHSANFRLDNMGVEVTAGLNFRTLGNVGKWIHSLDLGYTHTHQKRYDDVAIFKSNYSLEYLRHKFTAKFSHRIVGDLTAVWNLRWQEREGGYIEYIDNKSTGRIIEYSPYAVLDLKLQYTKPTYEVWVNACNLTNHTYHDFGNIPQPGLWVMAGARYRFNF